MTLMDVLLWSIVIFTQVFTAFCLSPYATRFHDWRMRKIRAKREYDNEYYRILITVAEIEDERKALTQGRG